MATMTTRRRANSIAELVVADFPNEMVKQLRRRGCVVLDSDSQEPPPLPRINWKKRLVEVKREFMSRRLQSCVNLCKASLEYAKDYMRVEPAYLIYLNFYAATSLDIQARALHHNAGPIRTKLLLQAESYYDKASKLALAEIAALASPPSQSLPSSPPSLHSPSGSVSSRSSFSFSTRASSPVSCIYSPKSGPRRKKSVTFSDEVFEPLVRPDSPTLGLDEAPSRSPTTPHTPDLMFHPASLFTSFTFPGKDQPKSRGSFQALRIDTSALDCSVHRYNMILSGLNRRITSHLDDVRAEVAKSSQKISVAPESSEELRSLELRSRVARLRASGWKRTRFDAAKYERLRDSASEDLAI